MTALFGCGVSALATTPLPPWYELCNASHVVLATVVVAAPQQCVLPTKDASCACTTLPSCGYGPEDPYCERRCPRTGVDLTLRIDKVLASRWKAGESGAPALPWEHARVSFPIDTTRFVFTRPSVATQEPAAQRDVSLPGETLLLWSTSGLRRADIASRVAGQRFIFACGSLRDEKCDLRTKVYPAADESKIAEALHQVCSRLR